MQVSYGTRDGSGYHGSVDHGTLAMSCGSGRPDHKSRPPHAYLVAVLRALKLDPVHMAVNQQCVERRGPNSGDAHLVWPLSVQPF